MDNNRIPQKQHNNQLHGVRLVDIIERLVEKHGWGKMGEMLPIRCFTHDPSVKSSLKFLRKTPWARDKVEKIYMDLNK